MLGAGLCPPPAPRLTAALHGILRPPMDEGMNGPGEGRPVGESAWGPGLSPMPCPKTHGTHTLVV